MVDGHFFLIYKNMKCFGRRLQDIFTDCCMYYFPTERSYQHDLSALDRIIKNKIKTVYN